jgi:hypothetical protein
MTGGRDSLIQVPPDGLWDECSEWVWLPLDYADDALRVKRKAFCGHGLPFNPAREGHQDYTEIRVSQGYVRPGDLDEDGWAGPGADTWHRCEAEHPNAVVAWDVKFA